MGWLQRLLGERPRPVSLDDENFTAEVLREELPVLIDAWSPGCAPCKQLEPVILALRARYDGRIKVCELGTHAAPQTATRLQIRATPSVLYFRAGRELDRVVGFRSSLYHQQAIEELFGIT